MAVGPNLRHHVLAPDKGLSAGTLPSGLDPHHLAEMTAEILALSRREFSLRRG